MWVWLNKAPSHLNLTQNSHFNDCGPSDFYEIFKNGFFDLKDIYINNTKVNQIGCEPKYMTHDPKYYFNGPIDPPPPPLVTIGVLADSVSFSRFQFKKKCQNALETIGCTPLINRARHHLASQCFEIDDLATIPGFI